MIDVQLVTSLPLTFFKPTKIVLFLKQEMFKRSWIRRVTERSLTIKPGISSTSSSGYNCSSLSPVTGFFFLINNPFLQTHAATDSLVGRQTNIYSTSWKPHSLPLDAQGVIQECNPEQTSLKTKSSVQSTQCHGCFGTELQQHLLSTHFLCSWQIILFVNWIILLQTGYNWHVNITYGKLWSTDDG